MTFKKHEKELIKRLVTDCWIFGFSEEESQRYIHQRLGKPISPAHFYRIKKFVVSNDANNEWLNHHARVGLVSNLRKRLDIIDDQIEDTLQMLRAEKEKRIQCGIKSDHHAKDRIDKTSNSTILSLKKELREEIALAHELDAASPILGKFKAILFNNEKQYPKGKREERLELDSEALDELWALCEPE